ncbi:unnamed protein product, partial [Iphiclides podalirius]
MLCPGMEPINFTKLNSPYGQSNCRPGCITVHGSMPQRRGLNHLGIIKFLNPLITSEQSKRAQRTRSEMNVYDKLNRYTLLGTALRRVQVTGGRGSSESGVFSVESSAIQHSTVAFERPAKHSGLEHFPIQRGVNAETALPKYSAASAAGMRHEAGATPRIPPGPNSTCRLAACPHHLALSDAVTLVSISIHG